MDIKKITVLFLSLFGGMLSSCSPDSITIRGTFMGIGNEAIYLEKVSPSGIERVDSVKTDNKGRFKFVYRSGSTDPVFLNLRLKNNQYIALLASPGEKIKISSLGNIAMNYLLDGSPDSELVRQLNVSMAKTYRSLDSLYSLLRMASIDTIVQDISRQISRLYVKQKQDNIRFVVTNANSMASLMALYQRMPDGIVIFGAPSDLNYFSLVADSLSVRHPSSPHVILLKKDVAEARNNIRLQNEMQNVAEVDFPDLEMADMLGKKHTLSSLKGKVILLTFWSAASQNSNLLNRELAEIYDRYHSHGFEIYQVSLDTSKAEWMNALKEQKLPWINVCDFLGSDSYAAKIYNIRSIPSNFIIGRDGSIAAKNLWGDELEKTIRGLL